MWILAFERRLCVCDFFSNWFCVSAQCHIQTWIWTYEWVSCKKEISKTWHTNFRCHFIFYLKRYYYCTFPRNNIHFAKATEEICKFFNQFHEKFSRPFDSPKVNHLIHTYVLHIYIFMMQQKMVIFSPFPCAIFSQFVFFSIKVLFLPYIPTKLI